MSDAQLWRINLKPDSKPEKDPAKFCIERSIVGVGFAINPAPETKEDYVKRGREEFQGRSWAAAINAILCRMKIGDLIWTRNRQGTYFLGRIKGEWRYVADSEYLDTDVPNVRDCDWVEVGLLDKVPGAVINAFRPASTVQLVYDSSAALYSQLTFDELKGCPPRQSPPLGTTDILQLLSAEDLEDVIAIYLQVDYGYLMLPSTCKISTMAIECVFVSREDGIRIGMQVKSGNTSIDRDDFADFNERIFLFAASGCYLGASRPNCICLCPNMIRSFVMKNSRLMPGRIQNWIRFVEQISGDNEGHTT